jgi:ABC-type lipoprotein export system ATPase subunit
MTQQLTSPSHLRTSFFKPRLDLEEAYVTSLPTHRLHFAYLEKKISLSGGDIVFLSGANGTGKSLFLNGLAGRFDQPMKEEAIHCHKLRQIGYGNACFIASFHRHHSHPYPSQTQQSRGDHESCVKEEGEEEGENEIISSSETTLCAMSRAGYICEESQAVGNINLGERVGSLTIGDLLLRVNGLLQDCTDDSYALHEPNTPQIMMTYLYAVLQAVSLVDRLFFHTSLSTPLAYALPPSSTPPLTPLSHFNSQELSILYSHLCHTPLIGLSGGEQQRLRLASLFLLERIRFDVHEALLPSSVISQLETQPMQLLLLDEPDHHMDSNFLLVLSQLLQTLTPTHQQGLILVVIMHQEVISLKSLQQIFASPPSASSSTSTSTSTHPRAAVVSQRTQLQQQAQPQQPILRFLKMRNCENWTRDKTSCCDRAREQYEILREENQLQKGSGSKITMSVSVLQEIELEV